ncbi:MAG: RsmE family RNA methyltransferase [Gemmatimonadales bacterium]|nr:RsmE family RNA methyltransferase [Gemmatimonadales bacterium]
MTLALLVPPGTLAAGATVAPDDEEQQHLRVRRPRDGEPVTLLDGAGVRATGVLRLAGRAASVAVEAVERVAEPVPLVLGVGAGDRDRWLWLVEKATELGVTRLVPLETVRSGSVATHVRGEHRPKLARRAREALKQCGGAWAPAIDVPQPLADFAVAATGTRWLAAADGAMATAVGAAEPMTVAVGPEGGFEPAEARALEAAGFRRVRLGSRVLRFETAALAAAAMVAMARHEG